MTVLRRPAPRFAVWAALLIAVAAAAGVANLSPWIIAALEFGAWVVVAFCERSLAGPWALPTEHRRVHFEPVHVREPVAPVASVAVPEPPVVAEPEPAAPVPVVEERPEPPPVRAAPVPTQWNIWTLEGIAKQNPGNEELGFLVVYLRDFADSEGLLPIDFDSLVRESFGELLPQSG